MSAHGGVLAGLLALGLLFQPIAASGAEFVIRNQNGAGEGLNDPSPRKPVGGNSGITLGAQRMIAFQYATSIWGGILESSVPIVVDVVFDSLACAPSSASLGFAGPASSFADFEGAPRAHTLYPAPLADRLAGMDLDPGQRDINAIFNGDIDTGCFVHGAADGWYYGLDGKPGADQIDLIPILLHELAHGLGFTVSVNVDTGRRCCSDDPTMQFDDPFMLYLEDHDSGLLWPEMTDQQRKQSAVHTNHLHWVGPAARLASGFLAQGRSGDHVEMYAPAAVEEGSSVAHFSQRLFPNELLEPFFNTVSVRALTEAVFLDIGWSLAGVPTSTPTATASATFTQTLPPSTLTPLPTSSATLTKPPTSTPTRTAIPVSADGNCDGRTSVADIVAVARAAAGAVSSCSTVDINRDERIDDADISAVIATLFRP